MSTCEVCGLPTSAAEPVAAGARRSRATTVEWHPRHVRAVHRLPVGQVGRWSCSRCGGEFGVSQSWAVDHQMTPQSAVRTFVVCPACAWEVRPTRLTVDHDRLIEEDAPQPLVRLVESVRERRDAADARIELRSADTHELAQECDVAVDVLAERLRERGLADFS